SSRRRHTRFSRDWSSDVCSSDLDDRPCTTDGNPITELLDFRQALVDQLIYGRDTAVAGATVAGEQLAIIQAITEQINQIVTQQRSEERRVGKERRCGWVRSCA